MTNTDPSLTQALRLPPSAPPQPELTTTSRINSEPRTRRQYSEVTADSTKTNDVEKSSNKLRVVLLHDSLGDPIEVSRFSDRISLTKIKCGTTQNACRSIPYLKKSITNADTVIINLGINDLRTAEPQSVMDDIFRIVDFILVETRGTVVLCCSLTPCINQDPQYVQLSEKIKFLTQKS